MANQTHRLTLIVVPLLLLMAAPALAGPGGRSQQRALAGEDRQREDSAATGVNELSRNDRPSKAPHPPTARDGAHFILRAPASEVEVICARHGLELVRTLNNAATVHLVRSDGTVDRGVLQEILAGDPAIEGVEPEIVALTVELAGVEPFLEQSFAAILEEIASDPDLASYHGSDAWNGYIEQSASRALGLAEAHDTNIKGRQWGTGLATVAVIDTGIDPWHPVLAPWILPGHDFTRDLAGTASEWSDLEQSFAALLEQSFSALLEGDETVALANPNAGVILEQAFAAILEDERLPRAFGHGTMVAGLIHLVAPTASILPLKAFRADGSADLSDLVAAIYYAVDAGAHVINMSFSISEYSNELQRAINYATRNGVVCVTSAGNWGTEQATQPASLGNVVGVAATDASGYRAPFSNYGLDLVTLAAPGDALITTYPGGGYAAVAGTSFSSALVSGTAAIFPVFGRDGRVERGGGFYTAVELLRLGAAASPDPGLGFGLLDVAGALELHRKAP